MSNAKEGSSGNRHAVARSFVVICVWMLIAVFVGHFRRGWVPILQPSFQNASPKAWSVVLFCIAVAALTMGFVQIFRMILPLRGVFHLRALEKWLGTAEEETSDRRTADKPKQTGEVAGTPETATPVKEETAWEKVLKLLEIAKPDVKLAIAEFEERRGAGSIRKTKASRWSFPLSISLYDLPIEQLSGQLNLAFEAALDDPKHFRNFILLTVGQEGAQNLLTIVQPAPPPPKIREGEEYDNFEAAMLVRGQSRGSISRTSQLRIDMFQISAGGEWRFLLRSAVLIVSIGLSFSILCTATADFEFHGFVGRLASVLSAALNILFSLGYAIIFGSISAYVAMFLRDLAAIVENKKRRTT